jgi:hypothetical protein
MAASRVWDGVCTLLRAACHRAAQYVRDVHDAHVASSLLIAAALDSVGVRRIAEIGSLRLDRRSQRLSRSKKDPCGSL